MFRSMNDALLNAFDGFPNSDETFKRSRNRSFDQHQILFCIHLDNFQVLNGNALRTQMPGEFLSFKDAAWVSIRSRGSGRACTVRLTMRRRPALKIVPLHGAGKSLALGYTKDI